MRQLIQLVAVVRATLLTAELALAENANSGSGNAARHRRELLAKIPKARGGLERNDPGPPRV